MGGRSFLQDVNAIMIPIIRTNSDLPCKVLQYIKMIFKVNNCLRGHIAICTGMDIKGQQEHWIYLFSIYPCMGIQEKCRGGG
jgi:hypothetical protein